MSIARDTSTPTTWISWSGQECSHSAWSAPNIDNAPDHSFVYWISSMNAREKRPIDRAFCRWAEPCLTTNWTYLPRRHVIDHSGSCYMVLIGHAKAYVSENLGTP